MVYITLTIVKIIFKDCGYLVVFVLE